MKKKIQVEVKKKIVSVKSISLVQFGSRQSLYLPMGKKHQWRLKAEVLPADATNRKVYWATSDPSVAVVDQSGVITGLKEGECTVTAYACDSGTVSDSRKVCVVTYMTEMEAYQYLREHPKVTKLEIYMDDADFREFISSLKKRGFDVSSICDSPRLNGYHWVFGSYEDYGYGRLWYWGGTSKEGATYQEVGIDIWKE